jgi:hypothetical protein
VLDVRKLLGSNVETCHLTNYSLSHVVIIMFRPSLPTSFLQLPSMTQQYLASLQKNQSQYTQVANKVTTAHACDLSKKERKKTFLRFIYYYTMHQGAGLAWYTHDTLRVEYLVTTCKASARPDSL